MEIRIKKADATVTVDPTKFPAHVHEHLFEYGVRQKLNDSISQYSRTGGPSTTKATAGEMLDHVDDMLARLYAGDLHASRGAVDTVEREAARLAMKAVLNRWFAKNKGSDVKTYTEKHDDAAAYLAANREKIMAVAEMNLELTAAEV